MSVASARQDSRGHAGVSPPEGACQQTLLAFLRFEFAFKGLLNRSTRAEGPSGVGVQAAYNATIKIIERCEYQDDAPGAFPGTFQDGKDLPAYSLGALDSQPDVGREVGYLTAMFILHARRPVVQSDAF